MAANLPMSQAEPNEVTIHFPRSAVIKFYAERNALTLEAEELRKVVRLGQAFYHHFQLDKVISPANKAWAEKLYHVTSHEAGIMIVKQTDWTC